MANSYGRWEWQGCKPSSMLGPMPNKGDVSVIKGDHPFQ
jgi:hypothetical protein